MNPATTSQHTQTPESLETIRTALRAVDQQDPTIRAVVELYADSALAVAHQQDLLGVPRSEPMVGTPIVVKDIYDVAGRVTGNGSAASPTTPAREDAEAVRRARAAGAIILAKVTTHEYAYGVNTPPTRNPHDVGRIPGGSSGGTAAAIAAGMAVSGFGTDTGGSIRIPAALCGVAGHKPTYGLVSRRGISAISSTLDHAGPLGRSVSDVARLLAVIAGHDPRDPYSIRVGPMDVMAEFGRPTQGLTIGVSDDYFCDRLTDDVAEAFTDTVAMLTAAGARVVPVRIPGLSDCPEVLTTIASVEALAWHTGQPNIARDRYGPDVVNALETGRAVAALDYVRAMARRAELTRDMVGVFDDIDFLISPTVALTAPEYGSDHVDLGGRNTPILDGLNALTIPANITGIPALSVPCGFGRDGLPIGFQIMGPPLADAGVLGLGATVERLRAATTSPTTTTPQEGTSW